MTMMKTWDSKNLVKKMTLSNLVENKLLLLSILSQKRKSSLLKNGLKYPKNLSMTSALKILRKKNQNLQKFLKMRKTFLYLNRFLETIQSMNLFSAKLF